MKERLFIPSLPSLALIEASGADAPEFLHGQFTNDVLGLEDGKATLSAWCNPKGRVIATFLLCRSGNRYWLALPQALKAAFLRRLKLYVLRASVNIAVADEGLTLAGMLGAPAGQSRAAGVFPVVPPAAGLNAGLNNDLAIVIAAPETLRELRTGPQGNEQAWDAVNVRRGIPWLEEQTRERFLPQELNLEALGALSYDKGCYPGQEIIARLRYRGEVKRLLRRATAAGALALAPRPGAALTLPGETKTIGAVISVAPGPEASELLVVLERAFIKPGQILAYADGAGAGVRVSEEEKEP